MKFFNNTEKAVFLSRPNRFTVKCELKGKIVKAYLPNPGRLLELLLPGTIVHLEDARAPHRALPFTAVAVERDDCLVMLHTHKTNDAAHYLLEKKAIKGLKDCEVLRREVTKGSSRFDFLLKRGNSEVLLEVKSCTLFSERMAMFPDAVTTRGKRHVEELAGLAKKGTCGAVLFFVHSPKPQLFLPEFHTDLEFSKALYAAKERISIFPIAVKWNRDYSMDVKEVKPLKLPWRIVKREAHDRGSYLFLLKLRKKAFIKVGGLGDISLRKGYYIYVGSARKNLLKRLERHKRQRKKAFWHIDYLRATADVHALLPILTEDDLECHVARSIRNFADWAIPSFGSSDCSCPSHLFGTENDPFASPQFHKILQYYRMERLIEKYHVL